jgi:H-type lectin domain
MTFYLNYRREARLATGERFPIYFDAPFLASPIVLMTAQSRAVQGPSDLRAFHGIANHVDQYGFTINVRSADFESGTMNWIAFGCGEACGG